MNTSKEIKVESIINTENTYFRDIEASIRCFIFSKVPPSIMVSSRIATPPPPE